MPRLIGAMIVLAGFALGPVAGPLGPLGTWLGVSPAAAQTDLDGHGPDAWRVTGVAPGDVLNARMGPGTQYPVIETFAHNERDLRQITCVPFYGITHFMAMSEAERAALPPRWCLMRHADLMRAGWVAQRYLTPDDTESVAAAAPEPPPAAGGDDLVAAAEELVAALYAAQDRADAGQGPDPTRPSEAARYFTGDIVAALASGGFGAHPLYGAQDFSGTVNRIAADPDQPMLRGMITIHADFTNFGQPQRASFFLRADTSRPGAPFRIFRVEHEGWSFP